MQILLLKMYRAKQMHGLSAFFRHKWKTTMLDELMGLLNLCNNSNPCYHNFRPHLQKIKTLYY